MSVVENVETKERTENYEWGIVVWCLKICQETLNYWIISIVEQHNH